MALNPKLIQFFIDGLQNANSSSLASICFQLFEHLEAEVKDNPVYDQYEKSLSAWHDWPDDDSAFRGLTLPKALQDMKSLTYSLYKKLASSTDPMSFLFEITGEGKYSDSLHEFNKMFIGYLAKVLEEIINANPELEKGNIEKVKGNKVFIVHGHDTLLKTETQLLLARAGVNNVVLHEQPDKGRTIIDKLIEEGKDSNFAIAILSPDDMLNDGTQRARQNVILEIGYFMGQLGKERVRLIVRDNIEIPSDLQGILYEKYDGSGAWKLRILKELIAAGIYADIRSVLEKL